MSRRRVVITGVGIVCPLGFGSEAVFERMLRGESGIDYITRFDTAELEVKIGGQLKDFKPERWIERREARRLDPFCHYAIAASDIAIEHAGLEIDKLDPEMCGVMVGSGIGGIAEFEEQHGRYMRSGPGRVSPFFIPRMMLNAASGVLGMRYNFQGANFAAVSACASAAHAIGAALRAVQYGEVDVALTGGSEAALTPLAIAGFTTSQALSRRNDDPAAASRPFDAERDGFVMGEGAGILVLEELERAKQRGAPILAEVLGFGMSADAYHVTQPHPKGRGAIAAIRKAVKDAGVEPEAVNYINAHGTSTALNDAMESAAINEVFGDYARKIAVSSTKSMIGHLLGASGGVELAATALSIHRGAVHPTINYHTPDPRCDVDCVPNEAREVDVDVALSNSLGFGGHNACVAIGKLR